MLNGWGGNCCKETDTTPKCPANCFGSSTVKPTALGGVDQPRGHDNELMMSEGVTNPFAQLSQLTDEEVCLMQAADPNIHARLEQEEDMHRLVEANWAADKDRLLLFSSQLEKLTMENEMLHKTLERYKSDANERHKSPDASADNNRVPERKQEEDEDAFGSGLKERKPNNRKMERQSSLVNENEECDAIPVADDAELLSALQGFSETSPVHRKGIDEGEAASALAKRYNWVLAIALPNPEVSGDSGGISWRDASQLFDKCFRGEEVTVDGASKQQLRFLAEKSVFSSAFKKLPDAPPSYILNRKSSRRHLKLYSGENGFITLFRNFVMTKLSLHCGLVTEAWYTEDQMKIVLLLSCTARDLLREADRQNLITELELAVVDPRAVMPVTKSYFLLLHCYFKLTPVKPDDELIGKFFAVLEKLRSESPQLKEKFAQELAIWEELEDDVLQIQSGGREEKIRNEVLFLSKQSSDSLIHPSAGKSSKTPGVSGKAPESDTRAFVGCKSSMDNSQEDEFGFVDPLMRIGNALEEAEMKKAFAEYLKLKGEYGFSKSGSELIAEANKRCGKAILQTTFGVLGLTPSNPFRSFEVGLYNLEGEGPSIWREFAHVSQNQVDHIKSPFSESARIRLVKNIIDREFDIDQMMANNLAVSWFPLDTRGKIQRNVDGKWKSSLIKKAWGLSSKGWCRKLLLFFRKMSFDPPLEEIRNYYGERIAMYFGFVSFLGRWMIIPAIIGIVANIVQTSLEDPRETDVRLVFDVLYGVGISLWSTLFFEYWKRKQVILATEWGQWNIDETEAPRPKYHGITRQSPIIYETETYFSQNFWEFGQFGRLPRQIISWCLLVLIALVMVTMSVFVGILRNYWIKIGVPYASELTSLMTSAQMFVFSTLGKFLARQFNEWENYRSASVYQDFLITKLFLFEFVNRFNVYFFIGFVKSSLQGCIEDCAAISQPIREEHGLCEFGSDPDTKLGAVPAGDSDRMCFAELRIQLTIVLIILTLNNVVELFSPLILPRVKRWFDRLFDISLIIPTIAANEDGEVALPHVVQEVLDRSEYGTSEVDGTFDDYLEIMILFGYVTLFSLVFPFASVIATALLLLELRVDGAKLFYVVRRPLPQCAENIGSWRHILKFLTWLSIFTNAAMLVWTFGALGKRFPDVGNTLMFAFLVFVLIFFKVGLECLVPDEPERIRVLKAHHEWLIQRIGEKDVNLSRDPRLSIQSVDLDIKKADTGKLTSSEEFGSMKKSVKARVSKMQRTLDQRKKKVTVRLTRIQTRLQKRALSKEKPDTSQDSETNDATFNLDVR